MIAMSKLTKDNFFSLDYDFMIFVESLGPTHEMPRDVEHSWQMRRNAKMGDMFWQLYSWIASDRNVDRDDYHEWLKMVKEWYTRHIRIKLSTIEALNQLDDDILKAAAYEVDDNWRELYTGKTHEEWWRDDLLEF